MSALDERLREELVRRGAWGDFVRAREELLAGGATGSSARVGALREVAPDLAEGMKPRRETASSLKRRKRPAAAFAGSGAGDCADSAPSAPEAVSAHPVRMPTPADFAGRRASWGETVDWVVANLAFPEAEVDLFGAPDAKALAYYFACRKSPAFMAEFMLKVGAQRLPKKVDEEDRGGADSWDGKEEYDLLAVIGGGS